MKSYVCKSCGYAWQSANPALECARFGCGSRLISEVSQSYSTPSAGGGACCGGSSPAVSYAGGAMPASDTAFRVLNVIALVFFCISALVAMSGVLSGGHNDDVFAVAGGFWGVGALPLLAAVIVLLTQMHRAWQVVQPAATLGRGLKIPTPGQAIGFLFIPFFNLYWMFIAFKGLMDAANALREDRHIPGAPFCSGVATAYAVVGIVGTILFPLWIVTGIAACVLLFPIARDVARIINTLR